MHRSILFVDDDQVLLQSFGRWLRGAVHVVTARSSAEALGASRDQAFDAIIVDYRLGDENGVDLIRALKERDERLRLLLLSGYASVPTTVAAIRAGADDVRTKPIAPKSVLRWVEEGRWDDEDVTTSPSLDRIQWEHVQRVATACEGNVSEAARRLGIERSTVRKYLRRPAPAR